MIDAYTIGITLALDDGVSAGIAAIAKDLALLDRAIDTSTLRLNQLRRVSDDVLSVAHRSPPARVEAKTAPLAAWEPAPDATPTSHAAPRDMPMPLVRPATPGAVPAAPAAEARPPPAVAPLGVPLPKPAPIVTPPPVVVTTRAVSPEPAAPVVVPPTVPAPVEAAPAAHIVQPAAPLAPALLPAPAAPAVAAPLSFRLPLPATPMAPRPASRPIPPTIELAAFARGMMPSVATPQPVPPRRSPPALQPVHLSPRVIAPLQPPRAPETAAIPPPARHHHVIESHHDVAPRVTEQRFRHAPAMGAAMPRSVAPPSTPPPASHATGGGDVFLDGVHVGRWLSRHLDHAATRPPAGMTGFDPRLSPSWAGATVSN